MAHYNVHNESSVKPDVVVMSRHIKVEVDQSKVHILDLVSSDHEWSHIHWGIYWCEVCQPSWVENTMNGLSDRESLFHGSCLLITFIERKPPVPIRLLRGSYDLPFNDGRV